MALLCTTVHCNTEISQHGLLESASRLSGNMWLQRYGDKHAYAGLENKKTRSELHLFVDVYDSETFYCSQRSILFSFERSDCCTHVAPCSPHRPAGRSGLAAVINEFCSKKNNHKKMRCCCSLEARRKRHFSFLRRR